MNINDKKKRAAIVAVMYYLEQEKCPTCPNKWHQTGKELLMQNRRVVQQRGRV